MDLESAGHFIFDKLQKELPSTLHYHSIDHVKDVLDASIRIAAGEGVNGEDLELLKTAAMFHDSGFTVRGKDHEEIGCDIARSILPGFGYQEEQITRICGMIMATKIPQTPYSHLEEILGDADLDYLGREDYWQISHFLFLEINESTHLDDLSWLRLQISFLEQHRYFTKSVIKDRREKKHTHLIELRQNLAELVNKS